jgi:hypothetical protein
MDRLDAVCGPQNWKVDYQFLPNGVLCLLSIKVGDEWITKVDGAECTDIEPFKGGISSALKRAGSAWGMGRYLYSLESGFVTIVEKNTEGAKYGKTKEGDVFYWIPPALPPWAIPPIPPKKSIPSISPQDVGMAKGWVEPGNGEQKEGYVFAAHAGSLANKHIDTISTQDLINFVDAIETKYQGKIIPPVTKEMRDVAHAEALKREGVNSADNGDNFESF